MPETIKSVSENELRSTERHIMTSKSVDNIYILWRVGLFFTF